MQPQLQLQVESVVEAAVVDVEAVVDVNVAAAVTVCFTLGFT